MIEKVANYNNIDNFIKDIAKSTINFVPDILALSLIFSSAHKISLLCLKILKTLWPNAVSIIGGTHATNCAEELLQNNHVDYVVRGEGEISLTKFIEQHYREQPIYVKGVYSKETILSSSLPLELSDTEENLDSIPFPDWELIDMEAYALGRGRRRVIGNSGGKRMASIMTTRGCPFRCTFCSAHTVHGRKMRFRSTENVIKEIKTLHERYDINLFIPEDDLFTANKKRIINLLCAVESLKISGFEMQFPSGFSINTLDEEVIDALILAGMKIATVAIESGSEYVQKNIIHKNCDLRRAKRIVRYLKSKGIIVRCYFILGFPSETKEQMLETISFAKSLQADWCVFNIAAPLIGSKMYKEFMEQGYIKGDIETYSSSIFQKRTFDTLEMSAVELEELAYRANLDCNFINNYNKINGSYGKAIEIYTDIVGLYPFHIIAYYCILECYNAMKLYDKAQQIVDQINISIRNDERALNMFLKYHDLMPGFKADYGQLVVK